MDSDHIIVNPGQLDEFKVAIAEAEVVPIGRKPPEDDSKKILLPHPEVSGSHAEICSTSDGWMIRDLGSMNGTTVNGALCKPGSDFYLRHGDTIRIAQYPLIVHAPRLGSADYYSEEPEDQFKLNLFINRTPLHDLMKSKQDSESKSEDEKDNEGIAAEES